MSTTPAGTGRLNLLTDTIDTVFDLCVRTLEGQREMTKALIGMWGPLYSAVDEATQLTQSVTERVGAPR